MFGGGNYDYLDRPTSSAATAANLDPAMKAALDLALALRNLATAQSDVMRCERACQVAQREYARKNFY